MTSAADEQFFILRDGRKLGYQVLGDPGGQPLFFFHGTPGSRLVLAKTDLFAQMPGIQLILPERPGYGISDPQPQRKMIDWADDVTELADALGLEMFSVSGGSGGGPYALVCGAKLPGRVSKVLLFNSAAPINFRGAKKGMAFGNRLGSGLMKYAPWLMKWMLDFNVRTFKKSPEQVVRSMARQLPEPDRVQFENSEFINAIVRDMREAYRTGSDGHLRDVMLGYGKNGWGFALEDIAAPVYIWHGEQDTLSPIQTVKRMADKLPNCQTRYLPDAAHLLIDYPHVVEEVERVLSGGELDDSR